jgi:hypothetical protein
MPKCFLPTFTITNRTQSRGALLMANSTLDSPKLSGAYSGLQDNGKTVQVLNREVFDTLLEAKVLVER